MMGQHHEGATVATFRRGPRLPNAKPVHGFDWDTLKADWLAKNLAMPVGQTFTLKDFAEELGANYEHMRRKAAQNLWTDELRARRAEAAEIGADEAMRRAAETEAQIRTKQATRAGLAQDIAILGLSRVLERMNENPKLLLPGDPAVLRMLDRLLRTGLQQEREALGLPKVVEMGEQMGEKSPLEELAKHRNLEALATDLLGVLGVARDKDRAE